MLLAATITAMTAAAGTTLIFAISNAATQTRDIHTTKTTGHYALAHIAQTLRQARAIGEVTTTAVGLWVEDTNGDDEPNVHELAVIRYDPATQQVTYDHLDPTTGSAVVSDNDFTDVAALSALVTSLNPQTVVWADGIASLAFTGYPNNTETRIVEVRLTIGTGADEYAFQTTASPKASADYLFTPPAVADPMPGSTRVRRAAFSRWDGFSDLAGY